MDKTKPELTKKVVSGPREKARQESIWRRFDRLQRSLRPLRKGVAIPHAEFTMDEEAEPRDPESGDLLRICGSLNKAGARYVVIGGMAMVLHGFNRGTEEVKLALRSALPDLDCRFLKVPRSRGRQLKDPAQLDAWFSDGSQAQVKALCAF